MRVKFTLVNDGDFELPVYSAMAKHYDRIHWQDATIAIEVPLASVRVDGDKLLIGTFEGIDEAEVVE